MAQVGDFNQETAELVSNAKDAVQVWQRIAAGGTAAAMVIGALLLVAIFGVQQGDIGFSARELSSSEFIVGVIAGVVLVLSGMIGAIKQRVALNRLQFTAYKQQLEQEGKNQVATQEAVARTRKATPPPPEPKHEDS